MIAQCGSDRHILKEFALGTDRRHDGLPRPIFIVVTRCGKRLEADWLLVEPEGTTTCPECEHLRHEGSHLPDSCSLCAAEGPP